jgi:biotin carboxylase
VSVEGHSLTNCFYDKADTLLILGAGSDQTYPIKIAQGEGLRVLAVDSNPEAQGFAFADEISNVSNRDIEGLKALCDDSSMRGYPVKGVLVMGTDIPHIAASLAVHLDIPGPSVNTGNWTTNKFLMKEKLTEAGVAVPWFALVENFDSLLKSMREHGGDKFIIKPTDRSGARGVFIIYPKDQNLEYLFNECKKESDLGEVLLEEFIEGKQISTETIMWKGKAFTPGFVDRNYEMLDRFSPNVIENGGNHPSHISGEKRSDIESLVKNAAIALGIFSGVAKGDVVIKDDGTPMIIEMAARLSGGDFSESLIPLGCGVNIVKAAIKISVGHQPDFNALRDQWEKSIANRYFFSPPGQLKFIHGLEDLPNLPWIEKFELWVKPGDEIRAIKYHGDRLGVFIVAGDSREEVEERVNTVYELVKFEVG